MEAPWAKVEPSVQEMGVPMVLISAQEEVMGQLQVTYMAPMVIRSGLASLETWITTSWQCGCRRVCSVSWNPWTSGGGGSMSASWHIVLTNWPLFLINVKIETLESDEQGLKERRPHPKSPPSQCKEPQY